MLTDLYLVRHAQPDRKTGVEYRALPGPGLTSVGQQQAREAAAFLQNKALEHLFVSPYVRAIQTAEQVIETLPLPIAYTTLVAEHSLTESDEQVRTRVLQFIDSLSGLDLSCIAVISHGSPIKQLLLALTDNTVDLSVYRDTHNNHLPPAGIWHIHHDGTAWQAALVFKPSEGT